jgi:hypothetical protein
MITVTACWDPCQQGSSVPGTFSVTSGNRCASGDASETSRMACYSEKGYRVQSVISQELTRVYARNNHSVLLIKLSSNDTTSGDED